MSTEINNSRDDVAGLEIDDSEYATEGGWLCVVENLIRWLRAASCYQEAYLLDKDAHTAPPHSPPHIESVALNAIFKSLARLKNNLPTFLTSDQCKELCVLRDRAFQFIKFRREYLITQAVAYERAVTFVGNKLVEFESMEPLMPIATFMAAADLAAALGVPDSANAVDLALRRFHEKNPGCRDEIQTPRRGEPRYVYRVKEVWPHLLSKLPDWRDPPSISD